VADNNDCRTARTRHPLAGIPDLQTLRWFDLRLALSPKDADEAAISPSIAPSGALHHRHQRL